MEPFHIFIICNFLLLQSSLSFFSLSLFTANLNKLEVSFNLLIRCCCDSGYPWMMKIDWLLWCSCENPNSPISTGDVTTLKPGAEATECIREAHCNSTHTLQLVNMAQYDPLVFLNSIKFNSARSYVSNSDSSHFSHLIVPAPFTEDFGSSIYENNGPSSVQNFELQWGLGVNVNLHLHMHVLRGPLMIFHSYCSIPTGTQKIKTSVNAGSILFFCHRTQILFRSFPLLFLIQMKLHRTM